MLINSIGYNKLFSNQSGLYAARNTVLPSFKGDDYSLFYEEEQQKIGFAESVKLISIGALKKVKEIITSVFNNPLQTLAAVGVTTAGLMALPLIGIPTAVGGGALAIGFAILALTKGVMHFSQYNQNTSSRQYDKARINLLQMGGDTIDLALSAPFIPKGIKDISRFSKYGNVGKNSELFSQISGAKGFFNKYKVLKSGNRELSRKINYDYAVEKELAKLSNLSDAEKLKIVNYLKDFNVPAEKIPQVVVEQYAKENGIRVKPDVKYATLNWSTNGCAEPNECAIYINDRKAMIKGSDYFSDYSLIENKLSNGAYKLKYKHNKTGQVVEETIDKKIMDDFYKRRNARAHLEKQSNEILTTWHERTHINDFAKMYKYAKEKGGVVYPNATEIAKQRYQEMAKDITTVRPGTPEAVELEKLINSRNNGTPASYIKEPLELSARKAENILMNEQRFQTVDKVFKETNKNKAQFGADITINALRSDSAVS